MTRTATARLALPVLEPSARARVDQDRRTARDSVLVLYPGPNAVLVRSASPGDAHQIHALIDRFVARGLLLPRTLDQVGRTIRDFVVAVEGGRVVGCAALRIYSETLAEVAALAVAEDMHGMGIGAQLVRALKDEARALGLQRLFALTLEVRFFQKLGFEPTDIAEFPDKIARDCRTCAKRSNCVEVGVACDLADGAFVYGRA